jgi:hypothetical protein
MFEKHILCYLSFSVLPASRLYLQSKKAHSFWRIGFLWKPFGFSPPPGEDDLMYQKYNWKSNKKQNHEIGIRGDLLRNP